MVLELTVGEVELLKELLESDLEGMEEAKDIYLGEEDLKEYNYVQSLLGRLSQLQVNDAAASRTT